VPVLSAAHADIHGHVGKTTSPGQGSRRRLISMTQPRHRHVLGARRRVVAVLLAVPALRLRRLPPTQSKSTVDRRHRRATDVQWRCGDIFIAVGQPSNDRTVQPHAQQPRRTAGAGYRPKDASNYRHPATICWICCSSRIEDLVVPATAPLLLVTASRVEWAVFVVDVGRR